MRCELRAPTVVAAAPTFTLRRVRTVRALTDAFIGSLTTSIGTTVLTQRTGAHVSWEDARQHAPSLLALALIKVVASSLTNFCLMRIELALFKVTHARRRDRVPPTGAAASAG